MKDSKTAPLEIERKFLIEMPDVCWLEGRPGCRVRAITQTYLVKEGEYRARVRKSVTDGVVTYTHTAKKHLTNMTRVEKETVIDEAAYLAFLAQRDPLRAAIEKTRYAFPYEGHVIEVDIFPFWTDQAVLETELQSEGEALILPPELHLIREVTDDPAYTNAALAKQIKEAKQ